MKETPKPESRNPKFKVRAGQREFERGVELHRITGLLARRQYGKTTIAARIALKKMMKKAGHTVVFGSVKLDLGREMTRKEAMEMQRAFQLLSAQVAASKAKLEAVEVKPNGGGENNITQLDLDGWSDIYESTRLEFRLYHSNSVFSRTKVVALTPDAVGETGDLILDEVGRVKKFGDVLEAVMPIIASNPDFRCIYTTTPPPDDTHRSFDLLAPPLGVELPVNPAGNWYRSELGVWVLRVTAEDAFADGVALFDDDTGAPISPEESRRRSHDKDAWDRNYGCKFVVGGSSAIGLLELDTAQRRGKDLQCHLFQISQDSDLDAALPLLTKSLGAGPVGIGVDWAASQKEGSNPTSVTVTEGDGENDIQRAVFLWKASNPDIQRERLRRIARAVELRPAGGRVRRLGQDATGQQLFCRDVAKDMAPYCPVDSIVMSETIELPGYETPVSKKTYLGDLYVAKFNDNRMSCPPERYFREDHRLPKKIKGLYVCEPQADGKHGDTFDSGKIASFVLRNAGNAITQEHLSKIRLGLGKTAMRGIPRFIPRRLA